MFFYINISYDTQIGNYEALNSSYFDVSWCLLCQALKLRELALDSEPLPGVLIALYALLILIPPLKSNDLLDMTQNSKNPLLYLLLW
jgi:hypothetical protein